jgi:pimeloyl-ACP methyl ester carboxylesterase
MPGSRLRWTLLAALVAVAVLASAAKCYPPGTRVVIFIEGVYSAYGGEGSATSFDAMRGEFIEQGYEGARLLHFGYNGGTFDPAGTWQARPYNCAATDRTTDENLAHLEAMIRGYLARHPESHFTLVGHSLGGYLAYREGVREAMRPEEQRLQIDVIVTLDAPLRGLDADKKLAIDLIDCEKTYRAGADIVADKLDAGLMARREAELAAMREAGIRLATIGNTKDCLFDAQPCAGAILLAEVESQVLDGADFSKLYEIRARLVNSHYVVLKHAQVMRDVVAFVGAP